MKISVVTVCYNSSATIADTLDSLFAQRGATLESVVKDGGSTDGTLDVLNRYADRIAILRSERDAGLYDALNRGIALATGDVIGILHSDDVYADDTVLRDVARVFETTDAECVYGDLVYVARENVHRVHRYWRAGRFGPRSFAYGWMPPHPTLFVRREVYARLGVFRTDMRTAADYELMLRFLHKERVRCAYLPRILVRMREGGASNVHLSNRIKANREDRRAWELNGLRPSPLLRLLKPLRKLPQFFLRP